MRAIAAILLALLAASAAFAIDEERAFDDPAMNARYRSLINEVRCPKCQNESIADSNAPIAADLRRQVRNMMAEGASDEEILSYLVSRYGNFITYRPLLGPTTWALWAGPVALLAIGGFVFYRIVRARAAQPIDDEEAEA